MIVSVIGKDFIGNAANQIPGTSGAEMAKIRLEYIFDGVS
jgi:hypothetical protein